jgi:predicted membrane protein
LLIGTAILVVSLALLAGDKEDDDDRRQFRRVFALLALCVISCFTHFYLVFVALSALFVLFLVDHAIGR